ncbi:hypothetical protein QWZ16_16465 [Vibrio ostreicida]|uniref:Uncharacterized protein n=1 Tax=Vibrio ostreicida TaxID=526588 RepID=A0ABT8BWN7_9VIBR|nr:hypothetical protein [Vibrio ostreicida]MDN3611217.1 hypothetical protein [Vibrio ostreicida]
MLVWLNLSYQVIHKPLSQWTVLISIWINKQVFGEIGPLIFVMTSNRVRIFVDKTKN